MTNILVVDDETDIEYLLSRRFRAKIQQGHYQFRFVHNGQDALTLLHNEPDIDLVLLDINMPDLDGLSLLDRLPALNPILQVVMVSAYGDMTNIRQAMNKGAFDFVGKPIDMGDLERTLDKTILHIRHLREARQLKVIDELKTRFFDNITHEFRTPLTLILTPLELLLREFTHPPQLHQSLTTIDRNARQLLRLINQLLDLAKLGAGQFQMKSIEADLGDYIQNLLIGFQPVARAKGLQLLFSNELAGYYTFDPVILESIVYNLVTNALKFTQRGTVTIQLMSISSDTGTDLIRFSVQDTGIGIATDQLPHIFNRFYQIDAPSANGSPLTSWSGTGIGLALVYELTQFLDGTLTVTSVAATDDTSPSGTLFTVDLPLLSKDLAAPSLPGSGQTVEFWNRDAPLEVPGADPSDTPEQSELPLLLLVDDNEALLGFLADRLSSDYRLLTASNGLEAWELAQQELPDAIISDVMMPQMDGFTLTHQLKTHPATDHIIVILLTAKVAHQSLLDGLNRGADDYIAKPFHLDELQARLANQLAHRQRLRRYYLQQLTQPFAETDTAPAPVLDPFLAQLYALIDTHLDDPLTVEWVASEFAMSRKTLYRKVHSLTQLGPNELIRNYRLRHGADLLSKGQPIAQIAYQVGFESPSHFSKAFRELYGQTPSEFARG